jgi:hypothetical protein
VPPKSRGNESPREDLAVLDWLRRIFVKEVPPGQIPPSEPPGIHVVSDADLITLKVPGAMPLAIAWKDLEAVAIVSGDPAAVPPELFWLLLGGNRRRPVLVPMGVPGEHDLIHAMQARLDGFDNMAVIEAMSAAGRVRCKVWGLSGSDKPDSQ